MISFLPQQRLRRNGLLFMHAIFLSLICAIPMQVRAEIRLGMTAALSGPSQELGKQMQLGIEACFAEVNAAGGIHGEQLRLIARDDGYEPMRAASNMHALINEDKVAAVIGNVGTPTAIVTAPIAIATKTLLFGAYSGAEILRRTPPDKYIINYRASYAEETSAMIDYLLRHGMRPDEIAFFTQRDAFGDDGYHGAIQALRAHGFSDTGKLVHARFTRNTLNVEHAVAELLDAPVTPRAVIMIGGHKPSAAFIRLARRDLPDLEFLHVSFGGSGALAEILGEDGNGVLVTQVVPGVNSELPLVAEYRAVLRKFAPGEAFDFISLEGYIVAKLMVQALNAAAPGVNSDALAQAFAAMKSLDIGLGHPVTLVKGKQPTTHQVWITRIVNGKFEELEETSMPTVSGAAPVALLKRNSAISSLQTVSKEPQW
jgi:ABC-type branched-subunit amino acid transport system substrate-binding protein